MAMVRVDEVVARRVRNSDNRAAEVELRLRRAFPGAKVSWRPMVSVNPEEYRAEVWEAHAVFGVPRGFFSGREEEAVKAISWELGRMLLGVLMRD